MECKTKCAVHMYCTLRSVVRYTWEMCALAVPLKLVQQWDTSRNVHVHNNMPIYIYIYIYLFIYLFLFIFIFSIVYRPNRLTLALVQGFDVGGSIQYVPKYTLTLFSER